MSAETSAPVSAPDPLVPRVLVERMILELSRRRDGAQLPAVDVLARREGVSPYVLQQVLEELERRHAIRRSGTGYAVARAADYVVVASDLPETSEFLHARGNTLACQAEKLRSVHPPLEIAAELGAPAEDKHHLLSREWLVDGVLGAVVDTYLRSDLFGDASALLGTDRPVLAGLAAAGFDPVRARMDISVDVATPRVARRLQLPERLPVITVTGRIDSRSAGQPVAVTNAWLRVDRFRVVVHIRD